MCAVEVSKTEQISLYVGGVLFDVAKRRLTTYSEVPPCERDLRTTLLDLANDDAELLLGYFHGASRVCAREEDGDSLDVVVAPGDAPKELHCLLVREMEENFGDMEAVQWRAALPKREARLPIVLHDRQALVYELVDLERDGECAHAADAARVMPEVGRGAVRDGDVVPEPLGSWRCGEQCAEQLRLEELQSA